MFSFDKDSIKSAIMENNGLLLSIAGNMFGHVYDNISNGNNIMPTLIAVAGAAYLYKQIKRDDFFISPVKMDTKDSSAQDRMQSQEKEDPLKLDYMSRDYFIRQNFDESSIFGKNAGYTEKDVFGGCVKMAPLKESAAYAGKSNEWRAEYSMYITSRNAHIKNYQHYMNDRGIGFADCTFYDKTGKEFKPFDKDFSNITDPVKRDMAVRDYSRKIDNALIYALDAGMITCKIPGGKEFDPAKDIADDYLKDKDYLKADRFKEFEAERSEEVLKSAKALASGGSDNYMAKARRNIMPEGRNMNDKQMEGYISEIYLYAKRNCAYFNDALKYKDYKDYVKGVLKSNCHVGDITFDKKPSYGKNVDQFMHEDFSRFTEEDMQMNVG